MGLMMSQSSFACIIVNEQFVTVLCYNLQPFQISMPTKSNQQYKNG